MDNSVKFPGTVVGEKAWQPDEFVTKSQLIKSDGSLLTQRANGDLEIGSDALHWQGYYDQTKTYIVNDVVLFNGCLYICTGTSIGVAPDEGDFYQVTYYGWQWKKAWVNNQYYYVNDVVTYNDKLYICIKKDLTHHLPTDTEYWDLLASSGGSSPTVVHVDLSSLGTGSITLFEIPIADGEFIGGVINYSIEWVGSGAYLGYSYPTENIVCYSAARNGDNYSFEIVSLVSATNILIYGFGGAINCIVADGIVTISVQGDSTTAQNSSFSIDYSITGLAPATINVINGVEALPPLPTGEIYVGDAENKPVASDAITVVVGTNKTNDIALEGRSFNFNIPTIIDGEYIGSAPCVEISGDIQNQLLRTGDYTAIIHGSLTPSKLVATNPSNELISVDSPVISDDPYDPTAWDGNIDAPSKNAVRDKIEGMNISLSNATITTKTLPNNTLTSLFEVAVPVDEIASIMFQFIVVAFNKTTHHSYVVANTYELIAAGNHGGTVWAYNNSGSAWKNIDGGGSSISGFLTLTTGINKVTVKINLDCNTFTPEQMHIKYNVKNMAEQTITYL